MKFRQGTRVKCNNGTFVTGVICGISMSSLPVIGITYIIKLDTAIVGYEYDCITCQELYLELI